MAAPLAFEQPSKLSNSFKAFEEAKEKKEAAQQAFLDKYDTNDDGEVTPEEKAAVREADQAAAREAFLEMWDADGDGEISLSERLASLG